MPRHVREFLHRVSGRYEESSELPSGRNSVMEVFAVKGLIPEPVGRKVRGGEVNAVGAHEAAGGKRRNSRTLSKRKPVLDCARPSAKRGKQESKVVAMQYKGDFGSEDSEDSEDYQPSSDAPGSSDSRALSQSVPL